MDSSIQIEERAGQWLARRDSGAWGENDQAAFAAWLEQSTLHIVAFVRLEAAWNQARRLKALSAGAAPGTVPSPEDWQLAPFFDKAADGTTPPVAPALESARSSKGGAHAAFLYIAASLLIAIGAGVALYKGHFDSIYSTPVGGTASVPMSDGSKVTLNTDSRIRLEVTATERHIELQQGEAFFEVARDPARPFVVSAGSKRIVAVGTQFSVRRDRNDVRVLVAEGKVRIETESAAPGGSGDGYPTLSAGGMARASEAGVLVQTNATAEIEGYLSWRTGYLVFRDTVLADAVAEFNRYNAHKIVIAEPAVAAIRVSGKFRYAQSEAFVRLLEDGFPIRARHDGGQIVLTERRGAVSAF